MINAEDVKSPLVISFQKPRGLEAEVEGSSNPWLLYSHLRFNSLPRQMSQTWCASERVYDLYLALAPPLSLTW